MTWLEFLEFEVNYEQANVGWDENGPGHILPNVEGDRYYRQTIDDTTVYVAHFPQAAIHPGASKDRRAEGTEAFLGAWKRGWAMRFDVVTLATGAMVQVLFVRLGADGNDEVVLR